MTIVTLAWAVSCGGQVGQKAEGGSAAVDSAALGAGGSSSGEGSRSGSSGGTGASGSCPALSEVVTGSSCSLDAGVSCSGKQVTGCYGTLIPNCTCQDRAWACSVPACPCALNSPLNGTLGGCPSVLQPGNECQFACNAGYHLMGSGTICDGTTLTAQTCVP
jgi:hypothetical protein